MLQAIVAISRDGAIGHGNKIPWFFADDLRHFKATTMGHAIVMGRKTYESLPTRPLKGRRNIVVTSGETHLAPIPDAVCASPDDALAAALESDPEPFVVGGAAIYAALWPRVEVVHLTEVHASYPDADVRFDFDRTAWVEEWHEPRVGYDLVRLRRA